MNLLDFVFPKRCVACGKIGSYLCSEDKKKIKPAASFCPVCLKPSIGGTTHRRCGRALGLDGLVCLFHYSSPIREMIHELKYRLVRDIQDTLVREVGKSGKLGEFDLSGFTLAPVPLSVKRKSWRGFNQSEILGKKIAGKLKIGFDDGVLNRIKDTRPQAKLPREQRIKEVFHVFKSEKVSGNYLLFDDVWTTGATVKAATAALKRKGARKVWGLVLATSRK